jgi:hypothetical protein
MVIRGPGPNLIHELEARDSKLVFLIQICSIILPIRVVAFSLLLRVTLRGVKSWYCEYARGKRIWPGRADAIGYSEANDAAQAIMSDFYRH